MNAMAPIDVRILEEAAEWLMRLHASSATEADCEACLRWRERDPEHARAWARAELLLQKLDGLPPALAMPALNRSSKFQRRAMLRKLALLLAAAPLGTAGWRTAKARGWIADYRTNTGEQREIRLSDGTLLHLNTASAVDVMFDARLRQVCLRSGEILIRTAPDAAAVHRPFLVTTAQGQVEALGTFFNVREKDRSVRVTVLDGAVRITPRRYFKASAVLHAGQQSAFTAEKVTAFEPMNSADTAWVHGMLMADNMRLADFIAELARYRNGILHCDPAAANIRISGAYPVSNIHRALAMLVSTYPVQMLPRLHGYWITISPRQK
jgi:transmembrane sensor